MAIKLYFNSEDLTTCHTLGYWRSYMVENDVSNMLLIEAKRQIVIDMFYCKAFETVGEIGMSCGYKCEEYDPMNGKSGRCTHYGFLYEATNKKLILINNHENN